MKKLVCTMLLICSLLGCSYKPTSYQFPNKSIPIDSVELFHNMNPGGIGIDENNMDLLLTLEDSEINGFMEDIYELPTERCGTPPPYGYGEYIAKVTYENGDIEMFGSKNIVYIPSGERSYGVGEYFFEATTFEKLFSQYIDISTLPVPPKIE